MKTRLLIADSNRGVRELRRRLFVGCGFDVATANGGVECIGQLRGSPPHVLLLDTNLLWGGADSVLNLLAEGQGVPFVPVVLVGDEQRLAANPRQAVWPVVARHAPPIRTTPLINSVQAAARQSLWVHGPELHHA